MQILRRAVAGTVESNDILVEVAPATVGNSIIIEVKSIVYNQFGNSIKESIQSILEELGVKNVHVSVNDRGAVDFVIRARVETAVKRASEEK